VRAMAFVEGMRSEETEMNPYGIVGSGIGSADAASLRARLMAWHDAMVAHERRLRSGHTTDVCDDECPHVEARTLWAETVAMLGVRASELTFLRSRALASAPSDQLRASVRSVSSEAETGHLSRATRTGSAPRRSESIVDSGDPSRMATAEF
jgi:hypothetical protein